MFYGLGGRGRTPGCSGCHKYSGRSSNNTAPSIHPSPSLRHPQGRPTDRRPLTYCPPVSEHGDVGSLFPCVIDNQLRPVQSVVWPHHERILSPFICVLCHSDRLFHGESCPRRDVVHPGCLRGLLLFLSPLSLSPGNSPVSSRGVIDNMEQRNKTIDFGASAIDLNEDRVSDQGQWSSSLRQSVGQSPVTAL